MAGYPLAGYPPAGYPPAGPGRIPPPAGPGRVPPPAAHGILGNVAKHYGIWVPPCGQTDRHVSKHNLPVALRTRAVISKLVMRGQQNLLTCAFLPQNCCQQSLVYFWRLRRTEKYFFKLYDQVKLFCKCTFCTWKWHYKKGNFYLRFENMLANEEWPFKSVTQ